MSPSTLLYLSRPPPLPFRLSFFFCCVVLNAFLFWVSCMLWSLRQHFWACLCRLLRWCFCWFVEFLVLLFVFNYSWSFLRLFVFVPSLGCSQSLWWVFDCHCSIWPSTSVSMSWYLMYFRFPLWHVFTTIWPLTDTCFSVERCVSRECSIWRTPFFSDGICLLRPLIALSLTSFLVVLFFNMFADLMNLFLSSSFWKWMNACVIGIAGHSILAFSIVIPISVIDFSGAERPPMRMFYCGILLSLPYLDSGLHVLRWVRHFCFRFFRPCQGLSLVSVVFFFHFHNGWVHPLKLCSDWSDFLQKLFHLFVGFPWVTFHHLIGFPWVTFICSSDLLSASITVPPETHSELIHPARKIEFESRK